MKINNKTKSYLGFARKAGKVVMGSETCISYMKSGKVKLVIIAEDAAKNTVTKIENKAKQYNIDFVTYGATDEISHLLGSPGRTIFGIVDRHFAEIIKESITHESN